MASVTRSQEPEGVALLEMRVKSEEKESLTPGQRRGYASQEESEAGGAASMEEGRNGGKGTGDSGPSSRLADNLAILAICLAQLFVGVSYAMIVPFYPQMVSYFLYHRLSYLMLSIACRHSSADSRRLRWASCWQDTRRRRPSCLPSWDPSCRSWASEQPSSAAAS